MGQRKHKSILFLCTGNYYRSRFAEILFNSVAGKMGLPWQASSRGLALERGVNNVGPMAVSAVTALEAQDRAFRHVDALAVHEELAPAPDDDVNGRSREKTKYSRRGAEVGGGARGE